MSSELKEQLERMRQLIWEAVGLFDFDLSVFSEVEQHELVLKPEMRLGFFDE